MRLRLIACACVVAVVALAGPAMAQPLTDEQKETARKHYGDAQKAMEAGEYEIAAREYAVAYDITKDPTLFYWIGLARQQSGDCDGALIYYGRYLKEGNPQGEQADRTRSQMAVCKKALGPDTGATGDGAGATGDGAGATGTTGTTGDGTGTTDAVPPGDTGDTPAGDQPLVTPAPGGGAANFLDEEPSWQRTAGWIAVGATVAFATTGAVMGLSAQSREEDIEILIKFRDPASQQPRAFEGNTRETYDELIDEGERFDTLAKISFGLAGVSAAAAALFFVLDATGDDPAEGTASRLVPVLGPDRVGVAAGWEF